MRGTSGIWLRADSHALGPVSPADPWVVSAGAADSFEPFNNATLFPTCMNVGGYRAINFSHDVLLGGVYGQAIGSNRAKGTGAYKWGHAGPGSTLMCVFDFPDTNPANIYFIGGSSFYAGEHGFALQVYGGRVSVNVNGGDGSNRNVVASFTDILSPGKYLAEFTCSQRTGYDLIINGGAPTRGTGVSTTGRVGSVDMATFSTSNSTYELGFGTPFMGAGAPHLGLGLGAPYYLQGNLYHWFHAPYVLSGRARPFVRGWLMRHQGLTALPGIPPTTPSEPPDGDPDISVPPL